MPYKIIKSKEPEKVEIKPGEWMRVYWYHVERWKWYWPFWTKISPQFNRKSDAKEFLMNKILW